MKTGSDSDGIGVKRSMVLALFYVVAILPLSYA